MTGNPKDLGDVMAAIRARDAASLRALVEAKAVDLDQTHEGRLPLVEAVAAGAEVLEVLLNAGVDVNGRDGKGYTALLKACELKDVSAARRLLRAGADPNAFKDTVTNVLRLVVRWPAGKAAFIRELVAAGADVNVPSRSLKGQPTGTALMEAARQGNVEAVRELLAAGADANAQLSMGNALVRAAEEGHYDVAEMLLAAGADPTIALPDEPARLQERAGRTPAELARLAGQHRVAELLSTGEKKAVAPPRSGSVREAWQRLEAALSVAHPAALESLRPGAAAEGLSCFTAEVGMTLPAWAEEFFAIHDGQRDADGGAFIRVGDAFEMPFRLLSLAEAAREWRVWHQLYASGEFRHTPSRPERGVAEGWFHPGWIPLTSNGGGDHHCLDLAPAADGHAGQVILLRHDDPARRVVAVGLMEWLDQLAADLATS